ncbi:MAG: TIGR03067 domain-containing protein [Sneathiella sp.]|uniref:TIGR03067 domain-containing protein n=1 Tax=Sneathiella sp. TaxID=1964365 RepID=UPI003002D372
MSTLTQTNNQKLQGTWRVETASVNGETIVPVVGQRLNFEGDHFRIDKGGSQIFGGQYHVPNANDPLHIDFEQSETEFMAGYWLGIYEVTDDHLTICDNARDMSLPRPTGFTDGERQNCILIQYRRVAD